MKKARGEEREKQWKMEGGVVENEEEDPIQT